MRGETPDAETCATHRPLSILHGKASDVVGVIVAARPLVGGRVRAADVKYRLRAAAVLLRRRIRHRGPLLSVASSRRVSRLQKTNPPYCPKARHRGTPQ